jgi:Bromodomain
LITSRSFEQEMFERASKKLGLEQAVLGTFEKEKEDDKPTQKEMEQLLKRGAYALLEDDNDEVTRQFCSDDIESILAKRTRTRVVEGTKTASWLNKQGMVVSKSKFSSETGGEGLDMDDPLFWQKVMPDFVTPAIMMQKLNELLDEVEGRVRGPGRGRGRWKKKADGDKEPLDDADKESAAQEDGTLTENGAAETAEKGDEDQEPPDDAGKDSAAQEECTAVENGKAEIAKVQETDAEKSHEEETSAIGETEKSEVASYNDDEDVDALLSNETLDDIPEEDDEAERAAKVQLSRTLIRKVTKFMSDLKSMMQGLFDDAEDEAIAADAKTTCQKLLLTISVKEKVFNEEHRHEARVFLKRLEGDRKRRCRTSDQQQQRFAPRTQEDAPVNVIREELRIAGRQRKKRRKRSEIEEDEQNKPRKRRKRDSNGAYLGDDGYLHHSDSEAEWSDVGEDIYGVGKKKKEIITLRDARRRRAWGADDDAATAAGRAWPVFPRNVVKKVLSTVINEVIKNDEESGGIFSEPVSKDDFPEYYQQIEKPMDYGTMKTKLENGEYRSAQSMQKDFVLILQNCRKFNAPTSDIVKEARRQHLMRPEILKMAATKHNLFLAEDGSVLETFDDEKGSEKTKKKKKDKPKSEKEESEALADADEQAASGVTEDSVGDEPPIPRKKVWKPSSISCAYSTDKSHRFSFIFFGILA